ncbi:DUF3857 domain-containing protein [Hymenobacter sp. ASUV-10]|uniref:DUF3857 domain-containing protein n=1 Tax=Hymenobacter aranciens TaxID=3063996 RepID=A0ABT9BC13_9BACT|nr:DUF3857 domain-containing protein [Hymenobacter sp. ASUV-10]MDO7874093.1 DUF3857 domain-containing protein [Hymenobacter sp. ASUV-10]
MPCLRFFQTALWVLFSFFLAHPTQAQPDPITFGQLEPQYLTAAPFAADTAAAAVILCNYGKSSIVREDAQKVQLRFDRITRIKILKKAGFDWAKVEVLLRHGMPGQTEQVTELRGLTYNLVAGKVTQDKLVASSAFLEKVTDQYSLYKFALPNVREGSVIEFSYSLLSDYVIRFRGWQFQTSIPTRWSEYRAVIPHRFNYKMFVQRTQPLAIEERADEQGLLPRYRWAMQNVPALRREPYMTTTADYVDELSFELADHARNGITDTWEHIDALLLRHEEFGHELGQTAFLKTDVARLPAATPTNAHQRLAAVRTLITSAVRCNDQPGLLVSEPLRRSYQETHQGNAATVNLLLVAALRAAGFVANPLLLSTRSHGRVQLGTPQLSQFNYVVAHVQLPDGEEVLLDATNPQLPYDLLPNECLNQQGRLLGERAGTSRWVAVKPRHRHVQLRRVQLRLAPDGAYSGETHDELAGYAGAEAREFLVQGGEQKFVKNLNRYRPTMTVSNAVIANRDSAQLPLSVDYRFGLEAESDRPLDVIYLSPLRDFGPGRNPFLAESRLYPVDFGTGQEETLLVTLTLPPGYTLVAVPKSKAVDLPDNGGRFACSVTATGNTLQLSSRLTLRKPVYAAAEYAQLRELHQQMLEKQAEKLKIRKQR